jgi:hypothetical protein
MPVREAGGQRDGVHGIIRTYRFRLKVAARPVSEFVGDEERMAPHVPAQVRLVRLRSSLTRATRLPRSTSRVAEAASPSCILGCMGHCHGVLAATSVRRLTEISGVSSENVASLRHVPRQGG